MPGWTAARPGDTASRNQAEKKQGGACTQSSKAQAGGHTISVPSKVGRDRNKRYPRSTRTRADLQTNNT